jgi:hypothetical protein
MIMCMGCRKGHPATHPMQQPRGREGKHQQQDKPMPQAGRATTPVISVLSCPDLLHD